MKRARVINYRFFGVVGMAVFCALFWGVIAGCVVNAGFGLVVGVICFVICLFAGSALTVTSR